MTSKAEFLSALGRVAIESTAMPTIPQSAIDAPLPNVFTQVLESVGGVLGQGDTVRDVQCYVDDLIAGQCQVLSLVDGVTGNRDPASVGDPHQLADIDYTIAPARLAVAENGSVWISGDDLVERAAVFICEHLVVVVPAQCLVGTMTEAVGELGTFAGGWGVFVSGPSKTADIEQALVMGAHGARSMTVFVMRAWNPE